MKARDAIWRAGAPVRWALVGAISIYQLTLSGALGGQCRFAPSCSHYAQDAIRAHGAIRGTVLGIWRILRCNPFGRGGIETVPSRVALHDAVIQGTLAQSRATRVGYR